MLAAGPWAALLAGQGLADVLVDYPRTWRGRLRAADTRARLRRPSSAILLPNSLEARAGRAVLGRPAARRLRGGRPLVAPHRCRAVPGAAPHQIDEYLVLAERCGADGRDRRGRVLAAPPTRRRDRARGARAAPRRRERRRAARRRVGVHLGADYGPAKLWPLERVVEFCRLARATQAPPPCCWARRATAAPRRRACTAAAPAVEPGGARSSRAAARAAGRDRRARQRRYRRRPPRRRARHARRHALRPDRSRADRAARPGRASRPSGAVRAVLLPSLSDRAPVPRGIEAPRASYAARRCACWRPRERSHAADESCTWPPTAGGRGAPIRHPAGGGLRERGHRVLLGVIPGDRFEAKAREAGLEPVPGSHLRARGRPAGARPRRAPPARAGGGGARRHRPRASLARSLARAARPGGRRPVGRVCSRGRSTTCARSSAAASPGALYRRTAAAFAVSRQIEARCREVGLPRARVHWIPGAADLPRFAAAASGRGDPRGVQARDVAGRGLRRAARRPIAATSCSWRGFQPSAGPHAGGAPAAGRQGRGARAAGAASSPSSGSATASIFTGYRDRDLPAVLAAADCFALMAAGSDESCRAALEAMAAGRPVVARAGRRPARDRRARRDRLARRRRSARERGRRARRACSPIPRGRARWARRDGAGRETEFSPDALGGRSCEAVYRGRRRDREDPARSSPCRGWSSDAYWAARVTARARARAATR